MKLFRVVPLTLAAANAFVARHHRHHKPVVGHRFSIGAVDTVLDELRGVAIVGRPVARGFPPYSTAEVNRLCTDGTNHVCSFLYGAAARAAREMGFEKIITYTLPEEGGASLRASGWTRVALTSGGEWGCRARTRVTENSAPKWRWEKPLNAVAAGGLDYSVLG